MHTYTYIYMFQYSSERLTQIARREMINRAKFHIYGRQRYGKELIKTLSSGNRI